MTAFRGWFQLNGSELTNSSRVVAHLGMEIPTSDLGIITGVPALPLVIESPPGSGLYLPGDTPYLGDGYYDPAGMVEDPPGSGLFPVVPPGTEACSLTPAPGHPGMFLMPDTAEPVDGHPGLYTPPDGARRWGTGLLLIGDMCWQGMAPCRSCARTIEYDDSWTGLKQYLEDQIYRVELAPWHSTRQPESAEFLGFWVTKVEGLGPVPVQRPITEAVGNGGFAGPHRDTTRKVTFEALVIGCTHAGANFGLNWLACRLRETNDTGGGVLRYMASHPDDTGATTDTLVREAHGVVLTKAPEIVVEQVGGGEDHRQANVYKVTWEFTITAPYVYHPPIELTAEWDVIEAQAINWVHAADCPEPLNCDPMPVLFSATCVPEEIDVVVQPPPVCGGCMPVSGLEKYIYRVPSADFPQACRESAVNIQIHNAGSEPLTVQAFWRVTGTDIRCESSLFPVQINGLPVGASVALDSINGRFTARYKGRTWKPRGIVTTPTGAPWRPTVIDRLTTPYEFVVQAAPGAEFEVTMQLIDREP
ncbi:hypothetical protein [Mycolicibacterium mucogenicum]|uniref:Minor tail protein n=1 Tax=Mycolicibacterium mucogenicum DSM 44124 TaxID=1226753 RepID=A0A8H2J916_MYCMU|nr:hypothetical protein [Mycolicibacterium mucogenicum]KAB7761177.1 hypothetical protein MMUC44124_00840 [Mycolicibacterium mucogenicum DSM 44124]QPG69982.1 hypothetical protein C1S78_002835 [Mycolicibacterium mucogenicum DSM 44124]